MHYLVSAPWSQVRRYVLPHFASRTCLNRARPVFHEFPLSVKLLYLGAHAFQRKDPYVLYFTEMSANKTVVLECPPER